MKFKGCVNFSNISQVDQIACDFDVHNSFSPGNYWLFCSKVFFFWDILEDPSFFIIHYFSINLDFVLKG
jgi:hypothetical protein